jgi:hypothetical protein
MQLERQTASKQPIPSPGKIAQAERDSRFAGVARRCTYDRKDFLCAYCIEALKQKTGSEKKTHHRRGLLTTDDTKGDYNEKHICSIDRYDVVPCTRSVAGVRRRAPHDSVGCIHAHGQARCTGLDAGGPEQY